MSLSEWSGKTNVFSHSIQSPAYSSLMNINRVLIISNYALSKFSFKNSEAPCSIVNQPIMLQFIAVTQMALKYTLFCLRKCISVFGNVFLLDRKPPFLKKEGCWAEIIDDFLLLSIPLASLQRSHTQPDQLVWAPFSLKMWASCVTYVARGLVLTWVRESKGLSALLHKHTKILRIPGVRHTWIVCMRCS